MLKLPFVDTVKLDKSLIDCIGDRGGEIMLRQVVRLCYELGLYTPPRAWRPRIRWISCARWIARIFRATFLPPLPVEKYTEKLRAQGAGNGLDIFRPRWLQ